MGAIFDALSLIVSPPTGDPIDKEILAELSTVHCPLLLQIFVAESSSAFALSASHKMDIDNTPTTSTTKHYYTFFLEALQSAVKIFRAVTQGLASDQTPFVEDVVHRLLPLSKEGGHAETTNFDPFRPSSPYLQKLLILIFTHVVGSYNREVHPFTHTPLAHSPYFF